MPKIEEIRKRLDSPRFAVRKRGMEELLQAGAREEFVARALTEKDKDLVHYAVEWLHPAPPPALLVHCFNLGKQPTPLSAVEFLLARHNYLYAEPEIFENYASQGTRLALGTVGAVGAGYLRSFAPILEKFLKQDLEVASAAFVRVGAKAITGGLHAFRKSVQNGAIKPEYTNLANEWSSPSQKIIAAALSLHRMDAELPQADLERLLAQERAVGWPDGSAHAGPGTLAWVRLAGAGDAQLRAALEDLPLHPRLGPDIGTTLLKRGMTDLLDQLAKARDPMVFYSTAFCHWPLLDHLEKRGFLVLGPQLGAREYLAQRKLGVAPPPWWRWLT